MTNYTPDPIHALCGRIKFNASDLISSSARLCAYGITFEPADRICAEERKMMRRYAVEIIAAIDAYEDVVCKKPSADEHQLDIEDGVASFEAYRTKREAQ